MKNECPFPPASLVVGYLRDSGHEEQELSVEQQLAELKKFCAQNSLILVKVYVDEARPGSSVVGRQQFHEMIKHFREGAQEAGVIIWKFSRFARDQDDSQFYKADLRRRNYIVYSLMDKIPDGPEGRFFEAALDWMNQKFLDDLSTDVKRGLRHLVTEYRCVPGPAPRGIKRVPVVIGKRRDGRDHIAHRWEPDPAWASRVRLAFELKAQGASLKVIRAQTGLYKNLNSYNTFFSNKIWIGILEFGEEIVIPDYCEPLISVELFEAVQKQLAQHAAQQNVNDGRLHPRRKNSRYLLSGLVYCPRCGGAMSGFVSRDRRGNTSERYGCGRAKRNGECDMPMVPKYGLEQVVIDELVDHLLQPDNLNRLQAELHALTANAAESLKAEQTDLRARLKGVEQALDNVVAGIEQAGSSARLVQRLHELETTQADLKGQLEIIELKLLELEDKVVEATITPAQIELAAELRRVLREGEDVERRAVLLGLVEKIAVERYGRNLAGYIWFYMPEEGALKAKTPSEEGVSEYTAWRSRRTEAHRHRHQGNFVRRMKNKPR